MKYDDLHWTFREIDGYNKDFNFIVSCREAGKSTALWHKGKIIFDRGNTFLLTRQQKVSISEIYLNDCAKVINKFIDDPKKRLRFLFSKGALKEGIVDIYAKSEEMKKARLMFRCVALSNQLSDMKSLFLPNCECHFGDEFIKNTRSGEKYLPHEVHRYKELINTFQREAPDRRFKSYLFGNPYSRANPYFVEFGVDITKIKRGTIWQGDNVVVQAYEIKQELRDFIREHNPLYKFDDAYTRYAFDGIAINDANMLLRTKQPHGFSLFCVIMIDGNKIGIYRSPFANFEFYYWVGPVGDTSKLRVAYAFDFADLRAGYVLIDTYGKRLLTHFAEAMQNRKVAFHNSQYGYWSEEIYDYL